MFFVAAKKIVLGEIRAMQDWKKMYKILKNICIALYFITEV